MKIQLEVIKEVDNNAIYIVGILIYSCYHVGLGLVICRTGGVGKTEEVSF